MLIDSTLRESGLHALLRRPVTRAALVAFCAMASLVTSLPVRADASNGQVQESEPSFRVEPVSGPSLLTRVRTGIASSSFGRLGLQGRVPAEIAARFPNGRHAADDPGWWMDDGFELSGADLYRLNCRSCHGAVAQGLGEVIPSLFDPIKASSPRYVQERMERRGRSISDEVAEKLARGAELGLRHRLLKGGQTMPRFAHLEQREVDALLGFLEVLSGVPGERATLRVRQPAERVGEHVVMATCLICHDSTQGRRRPVADRDVPALSSFTVDYSIEEFVRKVRTGSPEAGKTRGRMPKFPYLTREELMAAYLYLAAFPPTEDRRQAAEN